MRHSYVVRVFGIRRNEQKPDPPLGNFGTTLLPKYPSAFAAPDTSWGRAAGYGRSRSGETVPCCTPIPCPQAGYVPQWARGPVPPPSGWRFSAAPVAPWRRLLDDPQESEDATSRCTGLHRPGECTDARWRLAGGHRPHGGRGAGSARRHPSLPDQGRRPGSGPGATRSRHCQDHNDLRRPRADPYSRGSNGPPERIHEGSTPSPRHQSSCRINRSA